MSTPYLLRCQQAGWTSVGATNSEETYATKTFFLPIVIDVTECLNVWSRGQVELAVKLRNVLLPVEP